jgi:hypothetical protein
MGRPPIGKAAMTGAERVRKHREKHAAEAPVTNVTKPASVDHAELARVKARIAEVEQQRDEALADRATVSKMLDDGHRVIAQAKMILAAKAFVPADVYKTVLHAVHEDRVTDPKMKARYRTAFQFLKDNERALAKKPLPPKPVGVPSTWEEWETLKLHAQEERRAKRAAKRAAKDNPPKRIGHK